MYEPDRWVVVKSTYKNLETYKLFSTFYGSFLGGDEWRINSGITKIEDKGDYYLVHGFSSSIYKCFKESYGTSAYSASVLMDFIDKAEASGAKVEILSPDYNFTAVKTKPAFT